MKLLRGVQKDYRGVRFICAMFAITCWTPATGAESRLFTTTTCMLVGNLSKPTFDKP
jgi:hypothetical protein